MIYCPNCGRYWGESVLWPISCDCGGQFYEGELLPPDVLKKGINYAKSWGRWIIAGRPKRSDSDVINLRAICNLCDLFDGDVCTHRKCGCSVAQGNWFGDKLVWETESCPIKKW